MSCLACITSSPGVVGGAPDNSSLSLLYSDSCPNTLILSHRSPRPPRADRSSDRSIEPRLFKSFIVLRWKSLIIEFRQFWNSNKWWTKFTLINKSFGDNNVYRRISHYALKGGSIVWHFFRTELIRVRSPCHFWKSWIYQVVKARESSKLWCVWTLADPLVSFPIENAQRGKKSTFPHLILDVTKQLRFLYKGEYGWNPQGGYSTEFCTGILRPRSKYTTFHPGTPFIYLLRDIS